MERKRCGGCMKLIEASASVCPHCGCDTAIRNDAHQLPIGTVLKDQYRIGRVLGQGGFGITYLGWDQYLDIPVAIKEYYPAGTVMRDAAVTGSVSDVSGDDGQRFRSNRERFLREAKMLARFSQVPEVVQVKNFFPANNTAYIVMEYVEGITLKRHVANRGGRLEEAEALALLEPVVRTMDKVHRAGMIHRDLSPDNIMILPGGGVKVLDFGAVRDVSGAAVDKELTKSTQTILKLGYAPLEQYQKRGAMGPWTDVYALCATLCYCLTGEVPPDAPARMLGYEDIALEEIPGLSETARQALTHGLALRAEDRTASMEVLYRELFPERKRTAATVSPALPPKPEPREEKKPKPAPKKKRKLPAAIAAVSVVMAIAAAWMLIPREKEIGEELPMQTELPQIQTLASGTCGTDLVWTLMEDGNLIISGSGNMEDYSGGAARPWEGYADRILELTLEEGIQSIGEEAFRGTGVKEVSLPESVAQVGIQAFSDCPDLEKVTLTRNTVLRYDIRQTPIFSRQGKTVDGITLAGLQGGMAEDYAAVFGYCFEATGKVDYESRGSCTAPPYNGGDVNWFYDRDTKYLRFIGKDYMRWESPEFWVELPRYGQSDTPWKQFREEVENVYLSDGVRNIGHNAFEDFTYLNNIYIPETVEQFGAHSLRATGLEQLRVPISCQLLLFSVAECENLREVIVPVGYPSLGMGSLAGCVNLEALYCGYYGFNILGALGMRENFSFWLPHKDELSDPEPPKNLTVYSPEVSDYNREEAAQYGFRLDLGMDGLRPEQMGGCGGWGGWMLEEGVLTIGGCHNSPFYRSQGNEDQFAWNDDRYGITCTPEEAPWYPWREEIHTVLVKPGVVTVNRGMFCDMPNLKHIDFGTVQKLYTGAIDNCGIEELILPESMCTVAGEAVVNCKQLKTLDIQNGSEGIGLNAFRGNDALEQIRFSGGGEVLNGDVFAEGIPENAVIYAKEGSRAQRYAQQKGYPVTVE